MQPEWTAPEGTYRTGLKVANSLVLGELVEFVPIQGRDVSFYICGPTVYDSSHLGHARNYVSFDVIRRIMSDHFGYNVFCVMNITDVDDKIILKARKDHFFKQYLEQNPKLSAAVLSFVKTAIEEEVAGCKAKIAALAADMEKSEAERVGESKLQQKRMDSAESILTPAKWATFKEGDASQTLCESAQDALMNALDKQLKDSVENLDTNPVSRRFEKEFMDDMERLGVLPPDVLTRVSEYVPQVVTYVEKIIANGYGYASNGSVYFDTDKYLHDGNHEYGKLAPTKVGNVRAQEDADGALSTAASKSDKKCESDFVLWKNSKPGEPWWGSPWGKGRPGWHIECSAMATDLLGMTLDMHVGGQDLYFPHHENEIAQCEAYFHDRGCKQWVNYFLHSGHLHIDGLKMSKSLKNFISIRQAFEPPHSYTARQLRLFFVTRAWNKEVNFDRDAMEDVFATERTLNSFFAGVASILRSEDSQATVQMWTDEDKALNEKIIATDKLVHESFCNNFDTKAAVAALVMLAKSTNAYLSDSASPVKKAFLLSKAGRSVTRTLRVLGLAPGADSIGWTANSGGGESDDALIGAFYDFRQGVRAAAKSKDTNELMKLSDNLRDNVLPVLGLKFDDSELGWKRVDAEQAMQEMAERRRLEKQKLEKKLTAARNDLANLEKQSRPATSSVDAAEFSAFDANGYPTKMADGSDIPKNREKTLKKAWTAQEKAFVKFQDKQKKAGEKDILQDARKRIDDLDAEMAKF